MMEVIEKAVKNPELIIPYYHSIQNIDNKDLLGHEVLMRVIDNDIVYPPGMIFPEIEKNGFNNYFELELIKKALNRMSEIDDGYVFFNISVFLLKHDTIMKKIIECIESHGLVGRVVFEILEDAIDFSDPIIMSNLLYLKLKNIPLAIDDFGSNYSFFKRLAELPYKFIKLDKDFIKDRNSFNQEIIAFLVRSAESHNKIIICEGVETEDDLNYVKDAGITYCQGFYFSKPGPEIIQK